MTEAAGERGAAGATPMMAQYLEIKAAHPDALLFYRMGDFFEMFFEDAVAAAEALDIALTKRGRHADEDIPMCGVPVVRAESYLEALIAKGFRVAIAEQTEDPAEAKRRGGAKALVNREVVRVVTPGTLTEESLLPARAHNRLAAWAETGGGAALAWADISTGELTVAPSGRDGLGPLLAQVAPREVLVRHEALADTDLARLVEEAGGVPTPLGAASFEPGAAAARLAALYGVATLDGFGAFSRAETAAMGALADYLDLTQRGRMPPMRPPRREAPGETMVLDAATRRNLEIARTLSGERAGSLLAAVDRTRTGAGARLLEARLSAPLTDPGQIDARLDAVAPFLEDPALRGRVREALGEAPDVERALARLGLGRGTPRDLGAVRAALGVAARLAGMLDLPDPPAALAGARAALKGHDALAARLATELSETPPARLSDGGAIAAGVDADLDEARRLRDEGRGVIAAMQADYAAETGIGSLKVRHNGVLGYFVEVTAAHAETLRTGPHAERFIHRQTLANAVRFTTAELADLEARIVGAGARVAEIERDRVEALTEAVMAERTALAGAAHAMAGIDVAAAAAHLSAEAGWCRPRLHADRRFRIAAGRHPVVEAALRARGEGPFIANDCDLSAGDDGPAPLCLMTGPNMAGKSTYLRQNALIAVLAQAGLHVPAGEAEIGIVDRLFSRVGAADDLARGRSTFMVEMVETAAILNQAGPRALVILDEIGRGTATWDGLSIAWAVLEHLHDANRCRGLFATHYHELTALADTLPALSTATVAVREWEGEVIFLHEVRAGAADRSYGVQVARLAGLPGRVIDRARAVLETLERGEREGGETLSGLPLFAAARARPPERTQPPEPSALETRLVEADPDALTPREAIDLVYELRTLLEDNGPAGGRGGRG